MTPSRLTAPEGCCTPKSVWVAQVEFNGLKKNEKKSLGSWVRVEVRVDLGGGGGGVKMSEIHYVEFSKI